MLGEDATLELARDLARNRRPDPDSDGESSDDAAPSSPIAARGTPKNDEFDDANDQDAVDITDEADDVEELREIIRGFQNGKVSGSLPFYNILLAGAPAEVEAYLVDIQVHLGRLPSRSQRELLTMSNEIYPRRGADGLVAAAVQKGYLPAAASSDDEDLRVFLQILNDLEPLPVGELLLQGSERTLDIWVWRPFYKLFLCEAGICVYFGEVQSDSTKFARRENDPKATGRAEDWIIAAEDGGCGARGKEIGIGDSLGALDFAHQGAIEKILKSGRSARDVAFRNQNTPILWLIQNHKWCVVYVVWARSRDVVVAEYVGHCRNPISSQNFPLGVAKGVELFLKARQVIRHALHQITSVALRASPASLAEITNNGIVIPSTPNTIKFGLRSPPRKVARIAEDAMASRALLLRRDRQHNGGALLSTTSCERSHRKKNTTTITTTGPRNPKVIAASGPR
ncbi:hypothetical protein HDU88_008987 [Geranomyces variabilis]|nr:hypothetical protein HDU88_008987 [Geranomyces variabilis]